MRRPIADSGRRRNLCRIERSCYFFAMIDLPKGDRTRARILDEAVDLASVQGLGGSPSGRSPSGSAFRRAGSSRISSRRRRCRSRRSTAPPSASAPRSPSRCAPSTTAARACACSSSAGSPGSISRACPAAARSLRRPIEFDDVPGPVHDAAARHFGELQRLIAKFARAAKPDGDAEALAAAVIGSCDVASGAGAAPWRPAGACGDDAGLRGALRA